MSAVELSKVNTYVNINEHSKQIAIMRTKQDCRTFTGFEHPSLLSGSSQSVSLFKETNL